MKELRAADNHGKEEQANSVGHVSEVTKTTKAVVTNDDLATGWNCLPSAADTSVAGVLEGVGALDCRTVGANVGELYGALVGDEVGEFVGKLVVGDEVGTVGSGVGEPVGTMEGLSVGTSVGDVDAVFVPDATDGASVGATDGDIVGTLVGAAEGAWLGDGDGAYVGAVVGVALQVIVPPSVFVPAQKPCPGPQVLHQPLSGDEAPLLLGHCNAVSSDGLWPAVLQTGVQAFPAVTVDPVSAQEPPLKLHSGAADQDQLA